MNKMSLEEIVQQILSWSSLTREEVMAMIDAKKIASGGFLTDEAAARLVAAEHGVEIIFKKRLLPRIRIRQLVSGLNDVTISGRVLQVAAPRFFSRSEGDGQVAQIQIADSTGTIKVALWDEQAELVDKIKTNQIVKILHGYVRRSKSGEIELHIGRRGDIQITSHDVSEEDFPSIENFCTKIIDINEAHRAVNVKGVIQAVYPKATFQRNDGTQGKVMRVVLEDDTGQLPVVIWNEKIDEMSSTAEGTEVLIMNTKVVKNNRTAALELHVDNFTTIEVLGHSKKPLQVKDLKEGTKIVSIEGIVATKPVFREVTTKKGNKVSVTSFELADDTGKVLISAWKAHAKNAKKLAVGTKIKLKDVYVRKGFGNQLEVNTQTSSSIESME